MRLNRKAVRLLMVKRDIENQTDLAERMNVSRAAVSNWLRGDNISGDNVIALSKILGCSLDDIVADYTEEDTPEAAALGVPA